MRRTTFAVVAALGLAGCGRAGGTDSRPSVPAGMVPVAAGPPKVVDRGELVLRSAGEVIGHEAFEMTSDGVWLTVALSAGSTFPDPMRIEATMVVEPETWKLDHQDLRVERGGRSCTYHQALHGSIVEVDVETPDGQRRSFDREPRVHAEYYISLRPTISQTAICARADGDVHALESFSPWYIVRTAPRAPSTVPRAGGDGALDLVRVDESIDVYCDGRKLAIVHYAEHAFIAARTEYDDAAQALTASDPTDQRWAGELACP